MAATTFPTHTAAATPVRGIPKLTHAEAGRLAEAEFARVLALVEQLDGDDWNQPTDCAEWSVRDMVAHLAGACAGNASWGEFWRQGFANPYGSGKPAHIDDINKLQIADRADLTTDELLTELREVGPRAIRVRQRLPFVVRAMRAPMGPLGFASFAYLMDTIYTRDQWMHRQDLSRATGHETPITPDHDGRIVALVVRDIGRKRGVLPPGRGLDLHLTGPLDGVYRFGTEPHATITIDGVDFNRRASGRLNAADALSIATIDGDHAVAEHFIVHCEVPY